MQSPVNLDTYNLSHNLIHDDVLFMKFNLGRDVFHTFMPIQMLYTSICGDLLIQVHD